MQAKSNSQATYCSGEEDNTESENEEMINLALVAVHDNEVSSNSTSKVPHQLDLNMIDYDSNIGNRCDSTSESIEEHLSNESTSKLT